MKLPPSIATAAFVAYAVILTPGCGGSSAQSEWESAGAVSGYFDLDESECVMESGKPSSNSILCYWGYKKFDFDELATLPVPQERFGLHFGGSKLTDSHFDELRRFRKTEYLGLNDTRISGEGLVFLNAFPNLEALDLGRTQVSDDDLVAVSKLSKLRVLILSSTNISDAGAAMLSQMKHLEKLDVGSSAITESGLMDLASCPSLKYLGAFKTNATQDGIAAVKNRYPDLEVVDTLD